MISDIVHLPYNSPIYVHKFHQQLFAQYFYVHYTQLLHVTAKLVTPLRWPGYMAETCRSCV